MKERNQTHLFDGGIEGDAERLAVEAIAVQRSWSSRRRHVGLRVVTKLDIDDAYGVERYARRAGCVIYIGSRGCKMQA